MLGAVQMRWFISGLKESNSLWKIICSSVPLSFKTGWPRPEVDGYDGWTADRELFGLFRQIRQISIENLLFITGDVHFPYLLSYDPFINGTPFCYEAGATPLSAITLPPSSPDKTLNPTVIWSKGEFVKGAKNFGCAKVSADGSIKISFVREDGHVMFEKVLYPKAQDPKWKKLLRTMENQVCSFKKVGSIFAIAVCLFIKLYIVMFSVDNASEIRSTKA